MKLIKIATLLIALFCTTISMAQEHKGSERVKTLKIAYLTDRLELTSSEAEKFWPLYNKHEAKMETFRNEDQSEEIRKKLREPQLLTDAEANTVFNEMYQNAKAQEAEKYSFLLMIKETFSAKKALMLTAAERSFKKRMLSRYRNRHESSHEEKKEAYEERRDKLIDERNQKRKKGLKRER